MRRKASSVRDRILERARDKNRPIDPSTVRIMKAIEMSISKIETYITKASMKHDDNEAIFDAVFMDVIDNIPEKMLLQILRTQYIRELRGQSNAVSVISHYMNKAGLPVMSLDPTFKGMMRMPKRATSRTASEVLRSLEKRIARLERRSHTMSKKDRSRLDELQKLEDRDDLNPAQNKEYEALVEEYRKTDEYKSKRASSDVEKYIGDGVRLTVYTDGRRNSMTLTEMPAKGQKTVREYEWHFAWPAQYVRRMVSIGSMMLVQNVMLEVNRLGGIAGLDFDEVVARIETAIEAHTDRGFEQVREMLEDEPSDKVEALISNMKSTLSDVLGSRKSNIKASEVLPDNYREIVVRGKDFSMSCAWDRGSVSLSKDKDEYMEYMEGMSTHYATKTRASARKLWLMVDKMGESSFRSMKGEALLELLKKKRISMEYVPTVWR